MAKNSWKNAYLVIKTGWKNAINVLYLLDMIMFLKKKIQIEDQIVIPDISSLQ